MGFGTNPAFRCRSLVRSRIGAFRASDAGSNPAGSMLFYHTLMVRRPLRAVSELALSAPCKRYFEGSQSLHQVSNATTAVYIDPVGLTFIDPIQSGPSKVFV